MKTAETSGEPENQARTMGVRQSTAKRAWDKVAEAYGGSLADKLNSLSELVGPDRAGRIVENAVNQAIREDNSAIRPR